MKHSIFIRTLFLFLYLSLFMACDDKNEKKIYPSDPEGTEYIYLINDFKNPPTLFAPADCEGSIYLNNAYELDSESGEWLFISTGKIEGLTHLTEIPQYGWKEQLAIEEGYGYIAVNITKTKITYIRLFVEEFLSDLGAIKLKYQTPFPGKAEKIEMTNITDNQVELNETTKEITIHLNQCFSYSLSSSEEWVKTEANPYFIKVSAEDNNDIIPRTALIIIEIPERDPISVEIVQQGCNPQLTVSPTELNYQRADRHSFTFSISLTPDWKVISDQLWCTPDKEQGQGSAQVTITLEENTTGKDREAKLICTNSLNHRKEVKIKQLYKLAGEGSREKPYLIRMASELDILRKYTGEDYKDHYFQLINDIDLDELPTTNGWEPIGTEDEPFYGHILGNGYKITNLWSNSSQTSNGLFGVSEGEIHQLGVETAKYGVTLRREEGVLARRAKLISQCYTAGLINASGHNIGGIAGEGTVIDCYSTVKIENFHGYHIAGICYSAETMENCYFAGNLNSYINTYPLGNYYTFRKNCYYITNISGGNTPKEMKQQATYQDWDFENIWQIEEGIDYPTLRCFNK